MSAGRNHIKVFVSSTVYEFETELSRVFAQLDGYGYDVALLGNRGLIIKEVLVGRVPISRERGKLLADAGYRMTGRRIIY